MSRFEVRLYNSRVRELLEMDEKNTTGFDDRWADAIYEGVDAPNAKAAAKMIRVKFPPRNGFVITNILHVTEVGITEISPEEYEDTGVL